MDEYEELEANEAGLGFLPLLAAAVPAVIGIASQIFGSKSEDKARKAALKLQKAQQIEAARQAQLALEAEALKAKAAEKKWQYIGIAGAAAAGLGLLWIISRSRRK